MTRLWRRGASRLAGWRRRWAGLPGNVRGTVLLLVSFLFFTMEQVAAKMIGGSIPTAQTVFVRSAAQLLVVMPFLLWAGPALLRTNHLHLHVLRSTLGVLGLFCYFYSFAALPLATATSLSFTKSLFQTLLAGWILAELVGRDRWLATWLGFAGVLVVVQPGLDGISLASLAGIAGAATGAGLMITTKVLAARESTLAIMVYVALITTAFSAVPGLLAWRWPTAEETFWLCTIGLVGPMGQYFGISGWRAGEASYLAPVDYLRLLISTAAGFVIFAELPDAWTALGAAIIVGSTLWLTRRELRSMRSQAAERPVRDATRESEP